MIKVICLILMFSMKAYAGFDIGLGYSSFTSGQMTPSLVMQYNQNSWAVYFTSSGYASQYDYLGGYTTSYYRIGKMGQLFGKDVEVGFGGGVFYSQRGFRTTLTSSASSRSDFGLGPAFFARWNMNGFFVRIQSLLGIGSVNNFSLYFQDVSHFALGYSW